MSVAPRPRRTWSAAARKRWRRQNSERHDLRSAARRTTARRDRRHQHLRPQLRRPLRGQRACRRRPHRAASRPTRASWNPELPPLHACARGVGQIERVYHPDRLQYPLRRIGPRGVGPVRAHLLGRGAGRGRARDAARARDATATRRSSTPRARAARRCCTAAARRKRFLYMFGGCTELWSNMSAEAEVFAVRMTYRRQGRLQERRPRADRLRQLQADPHVGLEPGRRHLRHRHASSISRQAKKKGVRIVCVDPRRTRTSRQLADEHIFIQPSTDAAALIAMAYVIAQRGPARPGLLRPPRAGLRRGASAARRPRRRSYRRTCWA